MSRSIILNDQQIKDKIRRIAYQIYESNTKEKEIILAGIQSKRLCFAQRIARVLSSISPIEVILCEVQI